MKVLHLVSSGGLFGAEKVILNLAGQAKESTWVGALFNRHNPHLEIIEEAKKAGLKSAVFESKGRADLKTAREIADFLRKENIDILHTHNYKSDIIGFLATRMSRAQWVATNHVWHSTDSKMRFYEKIDAFVLKFAKNIFTVSKEIKEDLVHKGFPEEKLFVVDNGITISQFADRSQRPVLRESWNVPDDHTLILIAGRLAPEKGHDVLLKALSSVVTETSKVRCLIVGDGPLKDHLEKAVSELSLQNHVIFTGIRKDIADIYNACDIMVNASFIEGLPMVILEAMASHLPIIATRVGGVPQVIRHEDNGILLDAGQHVHLSQAILQLIKDPLKRHSLAEQAYLDVCKHFSDQRMSQDYQKYYGRLVNQ